MTESEHRADNEVRVITPRNILREKIGYGGLDPVIIEKAEELIAKADLDFVPYARTFLERIEKAVAAAKSANSRDRDAINAIVRPVMELKANGGMFGHALISEIADILLDFLEGLDTLNDDAIEIVDVHHRTLTAIVLSGMKGSGGKEGLALAKELHSACQRYQKKYNAEKT